MAAFTQKNYGIESSSLSSYQGLNSSKDEGGKVYRQVCSNNNRICDSEATPLAMHALTDWMWISMSPCVQLSTVVGEATIVPSTSTMDSFGSL